MLAFCRAEYGAVHLWRGRWGMPRRCWRRPSRTSRAHARRGSAARSSASPSCGGARGGPRTRSACSTEAGPPRRPQLCRARLALDRGEPRQAVDLLERLLRQLPADRALDRAPALELLVHARAARGELEEAGVGARGAPRGAAAGRHRAAARLRRHGRGGARGGRGDHDRARALLEDAVDRFERGGAPFEAARARLELATSLIALGRAEAAEREATVALDRLLELGAGLDAERARRILDACADGARHVPLADLTPREREVLRLLADGLTNRQIAERLVVSEHTVHRHVTNLLRKLDLPSRTAAAAHAVRSGLLDRPAHSQIRPSPRAREMARRGEAAPGAGATVAPWTIGAHAPGSSTVPPTWPPSDRRTGSADRPNAPSSARCGRSATTTGSRPRRSGGSDRCSCEACGISAGQRVLDVAAGTGNVAIRAAEAGARVVAADLTPENFEAGRREARARGVELEWVEADAESLPFGDGEFDVVTSSLGAIFAPDHQAVADELVRVCRPGGTIGMINFTPEGLAGRVLRRSSAATRRRRRAGALPPVLWGSEEHVRELFGDRLAALELTRARYVERSPGDARAPTASSSSETFGPVVGLYAALADQPDRRRGARSRLPGVRRRARTRARPAGPAEYHYEYLLVVARKRG